MPEPVLIKEAQIAPEVITVGERLRPVSDPGVKALIASIHTEGQIRNPIHLRQIKKRGNKPAELRLIAGAYRLAAAKSLGIGVPAKLWACTADQAAMMEIDDQVAGRPLVALDTAVFLAKRQEIYLRLYPEAKPKTGAELARARWNAAEIISVASFAKVTAEQFGMTERHVRNFLMIGSALSNSEINALRKAPKPVGMVELLALAKIGEEEKRRHVCEILGSGEAKTVAKALAASNGVPKPIQTPHDRTLNTLLDAWSRAPKAAKRAFVELRQDELRDLLDDLRGSAA